MYLMTLLLAIVVVGIALTWTGRARKALQEKPDAAARPCCSCPPCEDHAKNGCPGINRR